MITIKMPQFMTKLTHIIKKNGTRSPKLRHDKGSKRSHKKHLI